MLELKGALFEADVLLKNPTSGDYKGPVKDQFVHSSNDL